MVREWTKKDVVIGALIAGVFTVAAAIVSGVFSLLTQNINESPLTVSTLQIVDVSAEQGLLDIKLKNPGDNPVYVKELKLHISNVRNGGSTCGPLYPSQIYMIEGSLKNLSSIVTSNSSNQPLSIKLSQVVPAHGVDRFQVKLRVKKPKWHECLDVVQLAGITEILFDENGVITSKEVHMQFLLKPKDGGA